MRLFCMSCSTSRLWPPLDPRVMNGLAPRPLSARVCIDSPAWCPAHGGEPAPARAQGVYYICVLSATRDAGAPTLFLHPPPRGAWSTAPQSAPASRHFVYWHGGHSTIPEGAFRHPTGCLRPAVPLRGDDQPHKAPVARTDMRATD